MTYQGGNSCNCGAIFELSRLNGSWNETVIYSFNGGSDGSFPRAGLVFDSVGSLYGTTAEGGAEASAGTVFELTPSNGAWTETVLFRFEHPYRDGRGPQAGLIFDSNGNLFGTTPTGGVGQHGTVFELSPVSGGWTETVIHNFWSAGPYAGVIFDNAGNLYGTTLNGG